MASLLADVPRMVIGGIIINALSLILHVIGFSTTYWYKQEDTGHFGLWKTCGQAQKGVPEICIDNEDFASLLNDNFKAARALECLAFVSFVAALIRAVLKVFVLKEKEILNFVAGLLNLMAGGLTLIGVCVFATLQLLGEVKLDLSKFHYSFGLCIMGGIGGLISGIVFILNWKK